MDKIRIAEKNSLSCKLKDISIYIKRNNETIDRLKSQEKSDFNMKQIEKLKTKNLEYEQEIIDINQKISDISSGKLDNSILETITTNNNNNNKKNELANKKKMNEKSKKKETENKNLQTFYKMNKSKNDNEVSEYNMQKEFDRFEKGCASIPNYILNNLNEMPCNKGYIWKGIWCFGKLPQQGNDIIMFEKLKDSNILRIYEITERYRTIYEKEGKNSKKLVSKTERKRIPLNF